MQSIAIGKEGDDDDGGWFGFFSSKKTTVPIFDNTTVPGGTTNNYSPQQEQQEQQNIPQYLHTQGNWNALNSADFYRNVPLMPTVGASEANGSGYNTSTSSPSPSVYNTMDSSTTGSRVVSNAPVGTNPNVNYHGYNRSTTVSITGVPERKEDPKESSSSPSQAQSQKLEELEKSEELMKAELQKLKESNVEEKMLRFRRRLCRRLNRLKRRLRRRHRRETLRKRQGVIFDPIPGLFPKILVNRILKEREVEVIVHGPKGDIVKKFDSGGGALT